MRLFITIAILHWALTGQGQNVVQDSLVNTPKQIAKNYFGVKFGGLASSFAHNSGIAIPAVGMRRLLSWHAGLAMDLLTRKNYNARVEVSYNTKGAKETFANDRIEIESINKLQYVQLSALPLVVKRRFGKISPYVGLGGYYARRVGIKSRWKPGTGWEDDPQTARNLNVKNDFGYTVSLGIYVWRRPFAELRYEGGLNSVSSTSQIRNRSIVFSLAI